MPITLTTSGVPWARYKATPGTLAFNSEGQSGEINLAGGGDRRRSRKLGSRLAQGR